MKLPEVWLRGPVEGVLPLLMPAAHALLQAQEDLHAAAAALTPAELWQRPGGAAAIGFHLRHLSGSLHRLLAYAQGRKLAPGEVAAIRLEGEPGTPPATAVELLAVVDAAVEEGLEALRNTGEATMLAPRTVGRAALPSNVLGLLFHAAEHAQRHAGQAITTARIIRGG
ncbi:MAG TPA: DinB family protein [Gemmatimonadales bacterium]|nr:DinB family protein [Gemmatimonadales bacterium]